MKHTITLEIDHTPTVPEPADFDAAYAAMHAAHDRGDHREHWILDCIHGNDRFMAGCVGYWASGVCRAIHAGWLVFEQCDESDASIAEAHEVRALDIAGKTLPKGWHVLDRAAAGRAYDLMCARQGLGWYGGADASDYDVALQLALLGEVRYG